MRYKLPKESESKLISRPISKEDHEEVLLNKVGDFRAPLTIQEFKFATAVASFAQLLKGGRYMDSISYDSILELANKGMNNDNNGYRKQFVELVKRAKQIASGSSGWKSSW